MSVGQELLDVPLPSMVEKLAMGIAKAQKELDKNSVDVAKELAEAEIEVVPQITREIAEDGTVTYKEAEEVDMSLLQIGLNPTFYQFTEATIEVEMDIKTKTSTETNVEAETSHSVDYGVYSGSLSVEAEYNRKFGKTVEGTSRLVTKLQPKSPPPRLIPTVETVDNRTPANGGNNNNNA